MVKSSVVPKVNKTIEINLTTSFNCSQVIMQFMKKHKSGSIINITSINAEFGFPNNPAYIASKGGLKMLGKSMAKDWGKFGIRVNNLGPGYFKESRITLFSLDTTLAVHFNSLLFSATFKGYRFMLFSTPSFIGFLPFNRSKA